MNPILENSRNHQEQAGQWEGKHREGSVVRLPSWIGQGSGWLEHGEETSKALQGGKAHEPRKTSRPFAPQGTLWPRQQGSLLLGEHPPGRETLVNRYHPHTIIYTSFYPQKMTMYGLSLFFFPPIQGFSV